MSHYGDVGPKRNLESQVYRWRIALWRYVYREQTIR